MRRGVLLGLAAGALALAGCVAPQPATPLPDPTLVAMHEWDHGPPWGPEEQPWIAPPPVLAYAPGYWGPGYWGPSYWGPSFGLGIGVGRGTWWPRHRAWYGGGWRGAHIHMGRRGRR